MSWVSMTGYGRAEACGDFASIFVEARSVNHRYLDVHVRCPGRFASMEPLVRGMARDVFQRGKLDIYLNIRETVSFSGKLSINRNLLKAFLEEVGRIHDEFGVGGEVTLRDLIAVPDMLQRTPEVEDPANLLWPVVEEAVRDALAMCFQARKEEGERLKAVIREKAQRIGELVKEIRSFEAANRDLAKARFHDRIEALSGNAGIDPVRIQQEAAILVDRLDITEECDRLQSHLTAMEKLFRATEGPVGKRFDFLLQEVFRELNTAGNKSAHAGISSLVVEAKTELEKIREQIQNVE